MLRFMTLCMTKLIKYYDKALAPQSNNTNALNGKAYALSKVNRYEEAVYRSQTRKMACLLLKREEAMARFLILETCPKLNLCTTILLFQVYSGSLTNDRR